MPTHIIKNGVVVNTILATVAETSIAYPDAICIDATSGGIGWGFDGTTLIEPTPPSPVIPQSVTMRQAVLALLDADLLDDVEAIVAVLPRRYQLEWERAANVYRDNALVETVRQQKSMTPAQIDDLFIAALAL